MERICPNCQKEVEDHHQFCPFCDYDFPLTDKRPAEPAKSEKSDAEGKPTLSCPVCGKSVEPYHEWCPWCDADLPAKVQDGVKSDKPIRRPEEPKEDAMSLAIAKDSHDQPQHADPLPPESTKSCPFCGRSIPLDFMFCGYCRKSLQQGAMTEGAPLAEGQNRSPAIWQQMPAAHPAPGPTFPSMPASPMQGLTLAADSPWEAIPISLFFNAGKKYTEKTTDILEFMVINTLPHPLKSLGIRLHCSLFRNPLQSRVTIPLPPGVQYPLPIGGFFPDQPGRDVLQMTIDGTVMGGHGFHLTGSTAVEVLNREQRPNCINVNISAQGPVIGDVELGLPGREPFELAPAGPGYDRWVPLQLVWNIKEQEREARFFPSGCISSLECVWDPGMDSAVECLAPDAVPKAELITPHDITYCLLTGAVFSLGKRQEMNHICTVLYPEKMYVEKNRMISREHCRISIQKRRVSIQDISSNGTWLGDHRLPKNEDVALADGDKINIGGVLELQISIFTNGEQVLGVLLRRTQNKLNTQYVLARGPIPVGSRPGIPIAFPGISEICGVLFYHPIDQAWHFSSNGMKAGSPADLRLDSEGDLPIQNATFRFSL